MSIVKYTAEISKGDITEFPHKQHLNQYSFASVIRKEVTYFQPCFFCPCMLNFNLSVRRAQ